MNFSIFSVNFLKSAQKVHTICEFSKTFIEGFVHPALDFAYIFTNIYACGAQHNKIVQKVISEAIFLEFCRNQLGISMKIDRKFTCLCECVDRSKVLKKFKKPKSSS